MYQAYQDLLTTLAEEIGLDAASLIATEEVIIDDLPVGLQFEGEGEQGEVLLCSLLGSVPQNCWAEVARAMLMANHLWTGTGGATLGMLPENDMVSLSVRRPLRDLDAEKLAVMLAKTVDIGLAWQDFITQSQKNSDVPAFFDATAGLRA